MLKPPLSQTAARKGSLPSPKFLPSLPELPRHVRALEKSAKRRMRDVVVRCELAQRLIGRPAPDELRVWNELAESTSTLHRWEFYRRLNAP